MQPVCCSSLRRYMGCAVMLQRLLAQENGPFTARQLSSRHCSLACTGYQQQRCLAGHWQRANPHQIKTAAMNVNDRPHQFSDHGTALNVPPWPAGPPGGVPGGLPSLCRLPKGKILGVALPAVQSYTLPSPVVFLDKHINSITPGPQAQRVC